MKIDKNNFIAFIFYAFMYGLKLVPFKTKNSSLRLKYAYAQGDTVWCGSGQ